MEADQSKKEQVKRRAFSVASAEGIGIAVSLGSLAVVKGLAPERIDKVKDFVAEKVILPLMSRGRPWREVMTEKCRKDPELGEVCDKLLNPTKENKAWLDANKPKITQAERARDRADRLVDFGIMIAPGMLARLGAQRHMDHKLGLPTPSFKQYVFAKAPETAVVGAAMLGLTTVLNDETFAMKYKMRNIIQKFGFSKETAGNLTNYLVYAQIPNVIGMATNVATMTALSQAVNEKADGPRAGRGR